MPTYVYTARDHTGKLTGGGIDAKSEDEALSQLQEKGFIVTSISAAAETTTSARTRRSSRRFHNRVKIDDLVLFGRQLSTLLESGITLLKGLEVLSGQITSRSLFLAVEKIKDDIRGGRTFSAALARHPKIFSNLWVYLIEAGEAAGQMPAVLNQLTSFLEARANMQKKIITALIYPVILACVASLAIGIFVFRILPIFTGIFRNFNVELPLLTAIVVKVTDAIRHYFFYFFIAAVAAVYLAMRYIKTSRGKEQFDYITFNVPLFSGFFRDILTQRFAAGLAMLIKAGVPILVSLEIVSKTIGNVIVRRALDVIATSVRGGKSIAAPLEQSGVFPAMVSEMIAVGEESGALPAMLDKVAEYYEGRVTEGLARFAAMFEPIMIVFMGAVIGTLVISMFLPIFKIAQLGAGGGR